MPDDAEQALAELLSGGSPSGPSFNALRTLVAGYLRSAWPTLAESEVADTVDEALVRLYARREVLSASDRDNHLGYLLRTARNLQIDRFRARRDHPYQLIDETGDALDVDDRDILRLLDQHATLQRVQAALDSAARHGDTRLEQIIAVWLDKASELERAPSSREVAEELGIAHTTVQDALRRFRSFLEEIEV